MINKHFSPLVLASIIAGSSLIALFSSPSPSFAKEVCRKIPGLGTRCVWIPVADPNNGGDGGSTACFYERPVERKFYLTNRMNFPVNIKVNNDSYQIPAGERWIFTYKVTSGGDCGGTRYGNPIVSFDDNLANGYQEARLSIPENRDYYFTTYNSGNKIGLYPQ